MTTTTAHSGFASAWWRCGALLFLAVACDSEPAALDSAEAGQTAAETADGNPDSIAVDSTEADAAMPGPDIAEPTPDASGGDGRANGSDGDTDNDTSKADTVEDVPDVVSPFDGTSSADTLELTMEELDRLYSNPGGSSGQLCACYPTGGDCDDSLAPGYSRGFDPDKVCPEGELCGGGWPSGQGGCVQVCTSSTLGRTLIKAPDDSCPDGWICTRRDINGPNEEVWATFLSCSPKDLGQFLQWKRWKESRGTE